MKMPTLACEMQPPVQQALLWPPLHACLCAQSCPTLCNPMGCSLPVSSVYRISQTRILKWLPFPFPGDLPDPVVKPESSVSPALACILYHLATCETPHIRGLQKSLFFPLIPPLPSTLSITSLPVAVEGKSETKEMHLKCLQVLK